MAELEKLYCTDSRVEAVKKINAFMENGAGGGTLNMFDTVLKDHILSFEESKGLALQGTYVYKDAIAGSRYGYPTFYEKCVEEFQNATEELPWVQPIATGEVTAIAGGDMVITASNSNASFLPYMAMDGKTSGTGNGWGTNNTTTTQWWQVKFPYKIRIKGLTGYQKGDDTPNNANTIGRFYTSSDKTTPIGDEYSNAVGVNWNVVAVTGIPAEGIVTDTIYFEKTGGGAYGGLGEIKIEATYVTLKKNPNGHIFYDRADKQLVDDIFNLTGRAWFYGVDTENERIFLPRNSKYFRIGDESTVGTNQDAGLPNITAGFSYARAYQQPDYDSGAISTKQLSTGGWKADSAYAWSNRQATLNASNSNPIYGKTTNTVELDSVNMLLYICVGNTESEEAITDVIDITTTENDTIPLGYSTYQNGTQPSISWLKSEGQWNDGNVYTTFYNEFVQKIGQAFASGTVVENTSEYTDYDLVINQDDMTFRLPLLTKPRILVAKKEPTDTDKSWYNLYSDGWCEQGGVTTGNATNSTEAISLLKPYLDTNYIVLATTYTTDPANYSSTSDATYRMAMQNGSPITSKTVNGFATASYYGVSWRTYGYTSIPTTNEYTESVRLYFKVANAVQNLELLDVGKVMEEAVLKSTMVEISETSWAFPSDRYVDLTLGASGTTYTAPANGWYYLSGKATANNGWIDWVVSNEMYGGNPHNTNTGNVKALIPITKGYTAQIFYGNFNKLQFRFIYAEGDQ